MSRRRSAAFKARIAAKMEELAAQSASQPEEAIEAPEEEAIEAPDEEYDALSAKAVIAKLESGDLDIDWVENYEEANKARKTILNWIAEHG